MDQQNAATENTPKPQDKKLRMEQAIKRKKRNQIMWGVGIFVLGAALIGSSFWYARWSEKNLPGEYYPSVGQEHIPLGQEPPKPYNSNPPSSGAHFASPALWKTYDYEVPDQLFIHNMEHGGVWISYRPDVPKETIDQLTQIADAFGGSKIVMAPRSANDADVVIAAWERLLKIDVEVKLSDAQIKEIERFYRAFKNKGPEFVPDGMGGVDPKELIK
ncbi:MAG: DUF3105 domain-containing protein [Candidatus Sungbacteria bacterium]|nr:DUF3105 domain-containing protein [Candidatus Sungbacteria bacterium]